jgi:hypothetical protein
MLIASRNDGHVPVDVDYIKRVAYLDGTPDLKPLVDSGFLIADDSTCKQEQARFRPEERQRREETDKRRVEREGVIGGERRKSPPTARLSDEEFVKKLKNNSAYAGIDIDRELGKMDAWLATRPGRQKTRQFVVNWLNKIDKPLQEKEKPISDYDRKLKELKESRAKNAAAH